MMQYHFKRMALLMAVGIWWCAVAAQARTKSAPMEFTSDTVVAGDIVVPAGVTCIIRPGVTIKFSGYDRFFISGLLIAEGTRANPIVITAYGRPKGATGTPSWKGIEIVGREAYGRFRHCRIEGAYRNLVWESSPAFDSCEFVGNHHGLYCAKQAKPGIRGCRFSGNAIGIFSNNAIPLVLDNTITGNKVGVFLQLCAETVIGRNVIAGNDADIHVEKAFGESRSSMSLHQLWSIINQLY